MEHRMVRAIAWYQSLRPGHPSPCRFFPTCSEYASEAITTGAGCGSRFVD
ncbi:MAG: putative rane protein insertion efficiency factor [Actinomycetota bacterium]